MPLALSSAYAGRTGQFYRGGREIEAPPYTRSAEVARRLWAASAALTKLTERGAP